MRYESVSDRSEPAADGGGAIGGYVPEVDLTGVEGHADVADSGEGTLSGWVGDVDTPDIVAPDAADDGGYGGTPELTASAGGEPGQPMHSLYPVDHYGQINAGGPA